VDAFVGEQLEASWMDARHDRDRLAGIPGEGALE
jgi:hypothetical protein